MRKMAPFIILLGCGFIAAMINVLGGFVHHGFYFILDVFVIATAPATNNRMAP